MRFLYLAPRAPPPLPSSPPSPLPPPPQPPYFSHNLYIQEHLVVFQHTEFEFQYYFFYFYFQLFSSINNLNWYVVFTLLFSIFIYFSYRYATSAARQHASPPAAGDAGSRVAGAGRGSRGAAQVLN